MHIVGDTAADVFSGQMDAFVGKKHAPGSALPMQILYGSNLEMADALHRLLDTRFNGSWLPSGAVAPVLGAHRARCCCCILCAGSSV